MHSSTTTRPAIVAHRGFSAAHRENSPDAWRAAHEAGADVIEADIRMTCDGTLVCCHDADLRRLAGRHETIADIDAADLAAVTVEGSAAAPPLALLFSVLPAAQAILFDVKDERPEVLDRLAAAASASGRDTLFFGLHDIASVRHVRARTSATILGLLKEPDEEEAFFAAGGTILRLWECDAIPERLRAVKGRNRRVWVTTGHHQTGRDVGDFAPEVLRRMAADGAAGFLVNDPVAAREALAGLHSEPSA
ncbi:MAG: glycerophosphodiester phosphodiesterase family protein [Aurantimonas endophytica]|uniref:Glycerophosphoryl diester phosphodiesterase n=1 Tax=Aurantimonas endophytica TaxID=1522175 RepID=A0A7W6HCN7_9HYPH|nr:glycerophosphodiester phosphodiesterase family protein [Aurantimonas endophytica]MBB4002596.1 glycerophosphoryl diester phosphodiesterase [Aurantimonas endophytica]MCO6403478.1 glycerophosphodiester phosphodiesterase [Aurantimonas endophytica]